MTTKTPKAKILKEISKQFDEDIKNKTQPLYDIEQEVHKSTLADLKELFEAVGSLAFEKGKQQTLSTLAKVFKKQISYYRERLRNCPPLYAEGVEKYGFIINVLETTLENISRVVFKLSPEQAKEFKQKSGTVE